MAVYLVRALKPIEIGPRRYEPGDVFLSSALSEDKINVLEKMQRVAIVSTPPLSRLPDWDIRAKELAKHLGIRTVEQLLSSDPKIVAEKLNAHEAKIKAWQTELLSIFVISSSRKGG